MSNDVVVANCTSHFGVAGQLIEGQLWAADHPLVKERPELFDTDLLKYAVRAPDEPKHKEPKIETATADPGERRTTRGRATAAAEREDA